MAHRIRLGPPWEVTSTDDGRTRHGRRFGRPRTLDANERVWLVADSLLSKFEVIVNGESIGTGVSGPFAVDITHLMVARNEVVFLADSNSPLCDVALEIREPA